MRTSLFERLNQDAVFFRRSFFYSAFVGVTLGLFFVGIRIYRDANLGPLPDILRHLSPLLRPIGTLTLAYSYICLLVWITKKERGRRLAALFIPIGQMTLTNYVMQSVFALIIFFGPGFSLIGLLGPSVTIPIGIAIFVFQMWYSRLWLEYFNAGPLEYLWRSASTGKWLPWKKTEYRSPFAS